MKLVRRLDAALGPEWVVVLPVLVLLVVYAAVDRSYVRVWQSDLTLWQHAVQEAPLKPRPMVNYGLALLRAGRLAEAKVAFERARVLAQLPHVPQRDRADTLVAVEHNLDVINVLTALR